MLIAEAIEPHEPLRRSDLAIDESGPHGAAVREFHAAEDEAAGFELVASDLNRGAGSAPPVFQVLGLGKGVPHILAGRVERPSESEFGCCDGCMG